MNLLVEEPVSTIATDNSIAELRVVELRVASESCANESGNLRTVCKCAGLSEN